MTIQFKTLSLPGSHGPIIVGGPEIHVRRVKFWDLKGEAEIAGRSGGRNIMVTLLLHDAFTQDRLIKKLDTIDTFIDDNGTLEETGNVSRKFKRCTFDGYEPIPFGGQDEPGMLQDVAATLRDDFGARELVGGVEGGWFIHLLLRFRQLIVQ